MKLTDVTRALDRQAAVSDYARWVMSLATTGGHESAAAAFFAKHWPKALNARTIMQKAAVDPGTTFDPSWAAPLVTMETLAEAFVESVRPATVLGRMEGVRPAPMNTRIPRALTGTSLAWAGEGQPAPATAMSFDNITLDRTKVSGLVVLTAELARFSDPAAEALVRADLAAGIAEFSDRAFLDPSLAAVAHEQPASITNDAPEVPSSGGTAADVESDLQAIAGQLLAGGAKLTAPYWIMAPWNALYLATLRTTGGERAFPQVTPTGGTLLGIPVLTSAAADDLIVLIDAAEVTLADYGMDVSVTKEASVEMQSDPTNPADSNAVLVSLWQTNGVGIRATRYINWQPRHDFAAAYISGFTYGEPGSGA